MAETDIDAVMRAVSHAFEGERDELLTRRTPWVDVFRDVAPILDVGCGDGVMLDLLAAAGVRAVGLERDPLKAEAAAVRGHEIITADLATLSAEVPGSYGGVMAGHIIEHLTPADAVAFVLDAVRLLRPGGRLVILTPRAAHPTVVETFWLDLTHVRPYPQILLEAMLRAAGLRIAGAGQLESGMETYVVGELLPEAAVPA